ncbi:PHA/PHB synthase family protein [Streptomyces zagrosensis]|uniref:Polyhydroxyalkanoate synthase n=1 Tax=Streptomyces zagrosensis TaxID=1042984 RepID=A0A7W9Q9R3_9ACTN|nr:alpha/beta fold hydrolase [Streptomyces zagrosensis]MBB5936236.1 polyhydroxyalkanoate synthase [Streptomyces zagrosensis]
MTFGSLPYAYDDEDRPPMSRDGRTTMLRSRWAWLRMLSLEDERTPDPADQRFTDPAWHSDSGYRRLLQHYLTWRELTLAVAETPYLPARRRQQVQFFAQVLTEALAPVNFLPGNPAALRRAATSRGASLIRGSGNLLHDLAYRRGRPAKMPPGTYHLGEDLAATPGRVVFRNELIEVIQYEAQTAQVHQIPLLLVPAWVNKFYIYDLAPGRSLAEWAVREGYTVFAISLRDPDPGQTTLGLDEYLLHAPLRALDVVLDITGSSQAHLVGVCAGGMFAASTAAWLAAEKEAGVASLTLLMSALDYTGPDGNEKSPDAEVRLLTRMLTNKNGLVDGTRISLLFDLLRSRETVWQPLVAGWLMGQRPQPFDIWAWSEDAIDVPSVLFDQTMRIAADNTLARGQLRIMERAIALSAVTQDAFVVAGLRDHIIPWETVYKSARLLGGDVSFHLVPSGHVGSIINPPRPQASYRTSTGTLPASPRDWSANSVSQQESWWEAWSRWLEHRSGPRVRSRPLGNSRYPAGALAPGHYVRSGACDPGDSIRGAHSSHPRARRTRATALFRSVGSAGFHQGARWRRHPR